MLIQVERVNHELKTVNNWWGGNHLMNILFYYIKCAQNTHLTLLLVNIQYN